MPERQQSNNTADTVHADAELSQLAQFFKFKLLEFKFIELAVAVPVSKLFKLPELVEHQFQLKLPEQQLWLSADWQSGTIQRFRQ